MNRAELERALRPEDDAADALTLSDPAKASSPSLILLVVLASLGVLLYAGFLLRPEHRGDPLPYLLVVVAETWIIGQAMVSLWTILSSGHDPRGFAFHQARRLLFDPAGIAQAGIQDQPHRWPLHLHEELTTVDVFITTYGEDLEVVRRTIAAALSIRGLHRTIVLDDGRSDEVRDLARALGAEYLRRDSNEHAKAGNINHALRHTDGEFFVLLDADFVPRPELLHELLPHFADPKVAFVQSPQVYGNLRNLVARGAGFMQSVFYTLIQPGKNRFNAAFCVGTNVVFRRSAVEEVGGIYEQSKSEDIWTSILLHERGWRTVYTPQVLAIGDTPETIEAYTKQQQRWAQGGFEILLRHNPLSRRRQLTVDQRVQYLGSSAFYLTGVAPALLLLVPPLHIFLNLTPVDLDVPVATWALYYAGFYVMQVVVALFTMGSFRWEALIMATASFPIYLRALWNAWRRRDTTWHVTGAGSGGASPYAFIVPQLLILLFLALTTVVGLWKVVMTQEVALSLVWNALNTAVFAMFVAAAWREQQARRRANRLAAARPEPLDPDHDRDTHVARPVGAAA
ncbi:MAG: glycosyltransferase [Candidatus Nanopelagicales bacterium]|nr:glycosyltransferase [Candidatus Nanopelagicales bacterium]